MHHNLGCRPVCTGAHPSEPLRTGTGQVGWEPVIQCKSPPLPNRNLLWYAFTGTTKILAASASREGDMKLTKTDFLIYQDCPHNAWVKIHEPDIFHSKPLSVFDQLIIETGNDVDELARELFPKGELIERGDAKKTRELIDNETPVLYQPYFATEHFVTASDILVWNKNAGKYDLYEVKASTTGEDKKKKEELYTNDIAFQLRVLRDCGVSIGRAFLVRLNPEYIRGADLNIRDLFVREDFTERATGVIGDVETQMETALAILNSDRMPTIPCGCIYRGRSAHCTTFTHINPIVPEYSVHDISRIGLSKKKLAELVENDILAIEDVPDDFKLSEPQRNQVEATISGKPSIDEGAIAEFIKTIKYPIAFFDYETFPSAIPRFLGYRPFDQIPFQFSLHVIAEEGSEAVHHEFLFTEAGNPDRELIVALRAAMPNTGSVISWNKPFEMTINSHLGSRHQDNAEYFADMNNRMIDLRDPFSGQLFVHPAFKGKTSIKAVLPVLVQNGEGSYKELAIQEGATATETWNRIVTGEMLAKDVESARHNLLAYCRLDTLAMVLIFKKLKNLNYE